MAAKQKLCDVIECPICTETFSDPRTLPCIHSFCLTCIDEYIQSKQHGSQLTCPLCRKEFALPEGGVTGLPKNFFIGKLLHMEELSNSSKMESHCDLCDSDTEDSTLASVHCVECQQKLCAGCSKRHKKIPTTRSHRQVGLGDQLNLEPLSLKSQPTMCDKHSDEQLKLFCIECRLAMCVICYVKQHNAHKCSDFNEVAEEFRELMKTDVGKLVDSSMKYRDMLKALEEDKEIVTEAVDNIEREICERAEVLTAEIERNRRKLLEEVSSTKQKRIKQVDGVHEEIELRLVSIDGLKRYTEELSKKGTPIDIARETRVLHDRADELIKCDVIQRSLDELGSMVVKFTSSNFQIGNDSNIVGEVTFTTKRSNLDVSHWTPTLEHVIPAGGAEVGGVTSLGDQLYIVRRKAKQVEVYDTASTFTLQRKVTVNSAVDLWGVASCAINNCLYVTDHIVSKIHKVELSQNDKMTHWSVASLPIGVSVNKANNVLVACYGDNKIQEYTTDGTIIRDVSLSTGNPMYVTQLTNGQFVVTTWATFLVSVVSNDGEIVCSYRDETNLFTKLDVQSVAIIDSSDNILVCHGKVLKVMNSSLTSSCDLPLPSVEDKDQPLSLFLDEPRGRLYVGEYQGKRVLVFNNRTK